MRKLLSGWIAAATRHKVIVVNLRTQEVLVYTSRVDVKALTVDDTLEGGEIVLGWTLSIRAIFE